MEPRLHHRFVQRRTDVTGVMPDPQIRHYSLPDESVQRQILQVCVCVSVTVCVCVSSLSLTPSSRHCLSLLLLVIVSHSVKQSVKCRIQISKNESKLIS